MNRREFQQVVAGAAGILIPSSLMAGEPQNQQADPTKSKDEKQGSAKQANSPTPVVSPPFVRDYPAPKFVPKRKKPQLPAQLVEDFVIYAHDNLEMTKKLLSREPKLIYAAMDWGGGDFETALGGASHMGKRDVIEYLIKNGARIDIFAATALGLLDVVKGMLTVEPKLIEAKGPHGFDIYFHARAGGDKAADVFKYLDSVKPAPAGPIPPWLPKKGDQKSAPKKAIKG